MAPPRLTESIRWWVAAPIAAAVAVVVPLPAWAVDEFYSRDAYRWLQTGLTTITNLTAWPVLDPLIVVVALLVLYRTVRLSMVAARGRPADAVWEGIRRALRATGVLVLIFMAAWGWNYRRTPLEAALSPGTAVTPTVEALETMIDVSNRRARDLRTHHGTTLELSLDEVAAQLQGPMNAALETVSRLPLDRPSRPKISRLLDPFFRLAGVTGFTNPFGLETLVQRDLLPIERPFVVAHEWAHLAGQADEAEASAVGWLACMKGGPALEYSGSLYLIMEAGGALPEGDRRRAYAGLDPAVRADIGRIVRRTLQQNPHVQRAASQVYDSYLRANRVADGTASYGRALSLLLLPTFQDALRAQAHDEPVQPQAGGGSVRVEVE